MSYSRSEIFEDFAKIAIEKGLIKQAKDESKELKDYKNSVCPRAGSDTIEAIEALYGLKPDAPKSMQYERNIVEVAHPNQVIIAPSYDKMNGLVENVNERQRILINIMHKQVGGHLTQKKYAESDLAYALVRVANDMDNHDIDPLRILADTCIEQLNETKKKLEKTAMGPLVIAGIAAAVLGAVYLYNHINDSDKGLLANVKNTLSKIDSLVGEDWFHQTFYSTLKPEFLKNLKKFRADLANLKNEAERFNTIEESLHSLKTLDELVATSQTSGQDIIQKAEEFRNFLQNIASEINTAIEQFSDTNTKNLAVKDETWFSGLVSKIEPVLHGGWGLFTDRFDDIKQALVPLKESMDSTITEINNIDHLSDSRTKQVADALKQKQQYSPKKQIETPKLEGNTPAPTSMDDYARQLAEIAGE